MHFLLRKADGIQRDYYGWISLNERDIYLLLSPSYVVCFFTFSESLFILAYMKKGA